MERGSFSASERREPTARLLQEEWQADGTIEGRVFERIGKDFREIEYRGVIQPLPGCRALLRRQPLAPDTAAHLDAQAFLDISGRPHYSLTEFPGATITGIFRRQVNEVCRDASLEGTVLSEQQGFTWQKGWIPNAVIQRERWKNRRVDGVALSSYAGVQQSASYSGSASVASNCLGTIVQRDSEGVAYNYRAVVMADGSGYFYLQTDPEDLTVGWLQKVSPHP